MTVERSQKAPARYYGLSTDTKPTNPEVGSTFLETDTRLIFVYGDEWVLKEIVTVEQLAAVKVDEIFTTNDLLDEMLHQLTIMNIHLFAITGEEIDDDDD